MGIWIDGADDRVSEELSEVPEAVLAGAGDEPVTLGTARDRPKQALAERG